MIIKILGTGCQKCRQLTENAEKAVARSGKKISIEKITQINEIMNYGVMITPALVIDDQVKSTGKILTVDEISQLL